MSTFRIKQLLRGGSTHWISAPEQQHGYLVGVSKYSLAVKINTYDWQQLDNKTKRVICNWVRKIISLHKYTNEATGDPNPLCVPFDKCCTIGSWVHGDTLFLDACDWYRDLDTAIAAGHNDGQLAIWDLRNKCEITLVSEAV